MSRKEGILNDPAAQARMRDRDKRRALEHKQDIAHVMASAEGRRFMYELIFERCGLFNVYLPSDSGIYRHEGRRGMGRDLAQELQSDHTEAYIRMITERLQSDRVDGQIRTEALNDAGDE